LPAIANHSPQLQTFSQAFAHAMVARVGSLWTATFNHLRIYWCRSNSHKGCSIQRYHFSSAGPGLADGSFTMPALLHDVTVNEQPLPVIVGRVLLALNVTTPRLVPLLPV
jgi:hypothetical protein